MSVENEWGPSRGAAQGGAVWCGETVGRSVGQCRDPRRVRGFWELDLIVSRPR